MSPRFSSKDGLGRGGGQQISFNRERQFNRLPRKDVCFNYVRILTILTTFRILITFRILTSSFSIVLNSKQIEF